MGDSPAKTRNEGLTPAARSDPTARRPEVIREVACFVRCLRDTNVNASEITREVTGFVSGPAAATREVTDFANGPEEATREVSCFVIEPEESTGEVNHFMSDPAEAIREVACFVRCLQDTNPDPPKGTCEVTGFVSGPAEAAGEVACFAGEKMESMSKSPAS